MRANDYQQLASRFRPPESLYGPLLKLLGIDPMKDVIPAMSVGRVKPIAALLGILGTCTELGELAYAWFKWIFYGQELDLTNVKEEIGDLMWYIAYTATAFGINLSECMDINLNKLSKRYPTGYTDKDAAEENRDREAEREMMIKALKKTFGVEE